ncbi:MAG: Lsr2 protein, partial [Frankiales bacterium]|nr:Lsr2 protein [Frankiales bacterium]
GKCHRATPLRSYETVICGRSGASPRYFTEPYEHPTDTSATGPRHEYLAMVWLADRVCRWVCDCSCGHPKPAAKPVQMDLFPEVTV